MRSRGARAGRVAKADPHVNALALRLLDAAISRHLVEGRSFGPLPTEWHIQQLWTDVLRPRRAVVNLLCAPFHFLCPPRHPQRLNPLFAVRRLTSFVRRAARAHAGTVVERQSRRQAIGG